MTADSRLSLQQSHAFRNVGPEGLEGLERLRRASVILSLKSGEYFYRQFAAEDANVLQGLNPVRTPDSATKEILLPADLPIVRYREYLKTFDEKGWRIDLKALNEKRGDIAFAIPSPGRRTERNWVLDPVPLVSGQR